ncbi:hypothetical protein QQ008_29065 [Fulvivirgaceae bacterium BMA10]|uniref:Uncharacterized protein n=1 Tax=Splendidivirga corallicola TaxID=3051826 RepID=A0ABT8KZA8_9BACT|nr:hypothetical protein [Fulvivirgaceae bacterium BMA10]
MKTKAVVPNVMGKRKYVKFFPSLDLSEIFEKKRAKQRPPATVKIEEISANEIVLNSAELNP